MSDELRRPYCASYYFVVYVILCLHLINIKVCEYYCKNKIFSVIVKIVVATPKKWLSPTPNEVGVEITTPNKVRTSLNVDDFDTYLKKSKDEAPDDAFIQSWE